MVLQKRLDYGLYGYQVPPMPQVPKSAKGKRSVRRKTVDNRMCAFDFLASVAGKLLQEGEGYLGKSKTIGTSNPRSLDIKQDPIKLENPLKGESFDLGSCTENNLQSNTISEREVRHAQKLLSTTSTSAPTIVKSDTFWKDACGEKPSLSIEKPNYGRYGTGVYRNDSDPHNLEDKMDLDVKSLALLSSHHSVKVPLSGDSILCSRPFPKRREEKLTVDNDDDEKSFGCTQPSFRTNKALKPKGLGERRRKQLATKFWKVAPRMTKDRELSNTDLEMKPSFYRRKICYAYQRTRRSLFKRRRFFKRCSVSSIQGCNKEGVLNF